MTNYIPPSVHEMNRLVVVTGFHTETLSCTVKKEGECSATTLLTADITDSITDVTIHDTDESGEDDISDVSMDEGIMNQSHSISYMMECDCSCNTTTTNQRIIFGSMLHQPNNYLSSNHQNHNPWPSSSPHQAYPSSVIQHASVSSQATRPIMSSTCDTYETRWNTYQQIQDLDDNFHNKVPLNTYEQAIQFYEVGLTTVPRSVSLKDSSESILPPPLLFMGGLNSPPPPPPTHDVPNPIFRKRSLSESISTHCHSHTSERRCIFPVQDLLGSHHEASLSLRNPKSIQSYQYSSKIPSTSPLLTSTCSKRKLKSCIKNHSKSHSDEELTLTLPKSQTTIITPSTSNEKDLSVSFDPNVSIYDLGNRANIKYTHPGWSKMFT